METWINNGVISSDCKIYRSICVNKATVNENTQTINTVTPNYEGVTQIKNLNPYELQQAETMASCGGIEYEDITNIKRNTKISTLGNDASENMKVKMKEGAWINVRGVDFGTQGALKFMLRAMGEGTVDLRFGRAGRPVASMDFSSTEMEDHIVEVNPAKFVGLKNNFNISFSAATDVYVDAWQFIDDENTGIADSSLGTVHGSQSVYDLSGRSLSGSNHNRGIVIEQYTDEKGVKQSRKKLSVK
jgi:arabinoxylan arabinofuranohydrolase